MPVIPISAIAHDLSEPATAARVPRSAPAPASINGDARKAAGKAEVYQQFEALILKQFVEAMLPKDADNVYGGGFAGGAWKSMLADKIAAEIAARGTLGIAKALFPEDAAAQGAEGLKDQASFRPAAPQPPSASGARGAGPSEAGFAPAETVERGTRPESAGHDTAPLRGLAQSIRVNLAANRSWS